MKKKFAVLLLALIWGFMVSGCASKGASIKSSQIVERVVANGVSFQFEGKDIIQIVLNFKFDKTLTDGMDTSDEKAFRSELYKKLIAGAQLTCDGQTAELVYGYWPEKAGSTYADEMSLFYTVPKERPADCLKFVYAGNTLGKDVQGLETIIHP